MKKCIFFIIYGAGGSPEENWFPWLKKEVEQMGHEVFMPQFPTPENQTLDHWLKTFEPYRKFLNPEAIVIGHSLGVAFLLRILEEQKAQAAFFVASVAATLQNEFQESMKTFTQKEFDWGKIKSNCKHFEIFHSDNDPYIPLRKAEELGEHLNTPVTLVNGAGHFNSKAGYDAFPLLIEKLTQKMP